MTHPSAGTDTFLAIALTASMIGNLALLATSYRLTERLERAEDRASHTPHKRPGSNDTERL